MATTFCEKLEAVGATTFRDDRDIDGGDAIPDRLRREIQQSDEFLVLLTPVSVNRPWVLLETGAAWDRQLRIVAVRYHIEVDLIPAILKDKKSIHLNEFDAYLAEVRKRARGKRS